MVEYEYRVIPAPESPHRFTGKARNDDAFALTLTEILNEQGRDGWSYLRTDVVTERRGRWPMRHRTRRRELIVFRRAKSPLLLLPAPQPAAVASAAPVRARRIKRHDVVEFVRSGGRRVVPAAPIVTAAE